MSDTNDALTGALDKEELDTISEMTSIAMGAAGSTLAVLIGQEVDISAPAIQEFANLEQMSEPFAGEPKTLITVRYLKGLSGTSIFIIRNSDAAKMADMMLGSTEPSDGTLGELQMNAVGELMNQMMSSAATSLASVIQEPVEISTPKAIAYSEDTLLQCLPEVLEESFTGGTIQMKIGADATLELMEIRLASDVKKQVGKLLSPATTGPVQLDQSMIDQAFNSISMDEILSQAQPKPAMAAAAPAPSAGSMNVDPVTVRPVEFSSFDNQPSVYGEENKNLELVMDVTLNLTVELGKTELSIKDVLELTRGSVIELDRVAGEPVDLMANGKLIAKGEVVVIEDNFGLRITSIVSPADRLRGL